MKATAYTIAATVVSFGLLAKAQGASASPPWIDRSAALRTAAEITPADYPDADGVVVEEFLRATYRPDGTGEIWGEEYVKILTEKGRRERQILTLYFSLPYETSSVARVEILKPDGRIVSVDVARQSRVMIEPSQMGQNIYDPNRKVLQVSVPGLETGDVIYVLSCHVTLKPRVPETWSDYTVLEHTMPVKRLVYEVVAPRERPLASMAVRDEVPGTLTYRREEGPEGSTLHRWEVREVPRMFPEPDMPPLHTVVQRVLVSTIPDWREISRWYWNLCLPHLEATTPEMKAKVAEWTAGASSRREQIERLFRFVSQQIRYLGITTETEAPGYEPHDARVTFENRYGVCRDKAALLVSLLRLAGIPAYPVLIYVGPKKDEAVPQPYFNHAIAAAEEEDGSYLLMDPTDETTREFLPSYLCNRSYLVAHPRGEQLRVSPIVPATHNLVRLRTTGRLAEKGRLKAESVIEFDGINDNAYRGYFARLKPIERRRFFENRLKNRFPGVQIQAFDLQPDDLQDTSRPLAVRLQYDADDVLVRGDGQLLLPPLWLGTELGYVHFVVGRTGLETRRYPLVTDVACGVEETVELTLAGPVGAVAALPPFQPVTDPLVTFEPGLTVRDSDRLTGTLRFLIHAVEFSPNEYRRLREALKDIEFNRRLMAVFHPPADAGAGSDWRVLSDSVDVEVPHPHTWTVTRRVRLSVLTYAGIKRASEIKIGFNPAWSDVRLEYAQITSPTGRVHTVSPAEINLMDAPWVAAAPRYPPEKTLVVSLPGVEVGSTLEYQTVQTFRDHPFFSLRHAFCGFEPVDRQRLEIRVPSDFHWRIHAPREPTIAFQCTTNAAQRWTWDAGPLPPVTKEEALPPLWSFAPTVLASAGDWTEWAGNVQAALRAAARNQPATQALARRLTRSARTPAERILAVRDWVARTVRLAGPALTELPLTALTPADRTLADGYGHGADRAILLYALLEAAGLRPSFLLTSSWASRDPELAAPLLTYPQRDLFNTVLVAVDLDGRPVYLNDTDQYTPLGATAHDGRPALDEQGRRLVVRAWPEQRTRTDAHYHVQVSAEGHARMTACLWHTGMALAENRRRFAEMTPEERRRFYREMIAEMSQAAEPITDLVTDYEGEVGRTMFVVEVPRLAARLGPYLYLRLPRLPLPLFYPLSGESRENPLHIETPLERNVTFRVVFPPEAASFEWVPPPMLWEGPSRLGRVQRERRTSRTGETLALDLGIETHLNETVVPASGYPLLQMAERQLRHPGADTVMVRLREK